MRAPVPACTGRLAIAAGLAMALAAGLAPAAAASQPATAQAASRIPAAATPVQPHAVKLLYNQNNDAGGWSILSTKVGSGDSRNSQAADDFAVPKGQTWTISRVYVNGLYDGGTPVHPSGTLFFYKNAVNHKVGGNIPGALVKKQALPAKDFNGVFEFFGITGVTLPSGHYWMSVQFKPSNHLPTGGTGWWYWTTRTVQSGSPSVWENPGNGFKTGCTTWSYMQTCNGKSGVPDFMFGLYGSSKS